jgi:hypothetical protein
MVAKRLGAAFVLAAMLAIGFPNRAEAAVTHPVQCLYGWGKIAGSLAFISGLTATGWMVPPITPIAAASIIGTAWFVLPYQAYQTAQACR